MKISFQILRGAKQNWTKLIISFFSVALILWSFLGIYVIFYPFGVILKLTDFSPGLYPIPCSNPENIELDGKTLVISDLHLKYGEDSSRFSGLSAFIAENNVKNLIILGDLFNSPDESKKILSGHNKIEQVHIIFNHLMLNNRNVNVFFLKGSPSHDPKEFELNVQRDTFFFRTIGKCAIFFNNKLKIITIHGDDAFSGLHGFIISYLTGRPFLEAWWKDIMNIDDDNWVIMGHSHQPDIDYSRRVANSGGWTDILGFGPPKGRGILLENEVKLVKISN